MLMGFVSVPQNLVYGKPPPKTSRLFDVQVLFFVTNLRKTGTNSQYSS